MSKITLADKDAILKNLYNDDPDVWIYEQANGIALIEMQADEIERLRAENQFMSAQIDELNIEQPCGHIQRWKVVRPGTQYCVLCELDKMTTNFLGVKQL